MTKSKASLMRKIEEGVRKIKGITKRKRIEPRLKVKDGFVVANLENPEVRQKMAKNIQALKEWAESNET